MTSTEPTPFDLRDPLPPPGVTLLEASAGTGKTYTIAALTARYVAEGTPLADLLVITFTRAATSELRERVRSRLLGAHTALGRFLIDGSWDHADTLIEVLVKGDADDVETRLGRLALALSDFDTATITTTHGFCLDALAQLGLAGDPELDPRMVPEVSELVDQVTNDEYVAAFHKSESPLPASDATGIVRGVNNHPYAKIEPDDGAELTGEVRQRVAFAHAARAEIDRRKRLAAVMTFDDLQMRLLAAVADQVSGQQAVEILRRRYKVVLVDEFQDTDTVQWEVLARTFGDGSTTLLLIGDPKQAIYAFRGADVFAYLAAGRQASVHRTLATNFRSDQALLTGLDAVFGELELGDAQIKYRPVKAGDQGKSSLACPLRIRMLDENSNVQRIKSGAVQADAGNEFVAADLAADIVTKLKGGTAVPRDIAVLVDKHKDARLIQQKLLDLGVPSVIRGNTSVFGTDAATAWQRLLECLDQPNNGRGVRRLAASEMLGWSGNAIAEADDEQWAQLHRQVSGWADILVENGVAAMFEAVAQECGLRPRLLHLPNGERRLTDLQQIAELLNSQAVQTQPLAASLGVWLRQRMQETAIDIDERTRRLDTDAEAVQVVTIHAAKGLEFDIVYCPFLWHAPWSPPGPPTHVYHRDGVRIIEVGGSQSPTHQEAKLAEAAESLGEDLRKAYVALTRARHELVIWWASGHMGAKSPLARILCPDGPSPKAVADRIAQLPTQTASIKVELVSEPPAVGPIVIDTGQVGKDLLVNHFGRDLDQNWRRTSFSGITSKIHDAHIGVEVSSQLKTDEPDGEGVESGPVAGDDNAAELRSTMLVLGDVPGGVRTGTFVHAVFENIDFTATDLHGEVRCEIDRQMRWRALPGTDPDVLAAGIATAIQTPLDPDRSRVSLRDVGCADRVDEMGFEFAVANNSSAHPVVTIEAIADVLRTHIGPGDPLEGYAELLADPFLNARFRGYLSGSIDLLLRLPTVSADADADYLFTVADYKTNRLGGVDGTAWDYRPAALRDAMFDAHYPLQFLIYTIAAHRYLRWRLPGYDPAQHIGPVKYLFIRGMLGANGPSVAGQSCGVFTWQPSAALICDLSDLFDQGVPA